MVVSWRALRGVVVALTLAEVSAQAQNSSECGSGATAAAVVFAILFLLALVALGLVLYKYVWKPRHRPSLEKVVLAENGHEEGRFAFDNPYFEGDDEIGNKSTLPSNDVLAANAKTGTGRSADSKAGKKTPWSPFAVFSSNPKIERRRAFDDSFLSEPERVSVPLRGHDFTGLGFNICGNMREGIFVKDVLHRGPASESGQVRAGDRITGISVSFAHVVFEDALTILSYASPYDVQLHLEKDAAPGAAKKPPVTSQPSTASERLCHPFYRSQSIDDLTKIGRTKRLSAKRSVRTTIHAISEASAKPEGSLTPKASSFNEKLLSKTPPAPRAETSRLVQRDHLAVEMPDTSTTGYREMAVDVPVDILAEDAKRKAEQAKLNKLGVKVLPDARIQTSPQGPTDAASGDLSAGFGQAPADVTSSVTLQSEATVPVTGGLSPGTSSSDDADHKTERSKFKMGISGFGFKKQKPTKSESDAKQDDGADAVDSSVKMSDSEERSKKTGGIGGINMKLPKFGGSKPVFENEKYVKRDEDADLEPPQPLVTEVEKLKSAMNSGGPAPKPGSTSSSSSSDIDAIEVDNSVQSESADKKDIKSKSWGLKGLKKGLGFGKKPESDEKDRKTSLSSSSGEEGKELQADISEEMRLAAGVAQERRQKRTRHVSEGSSSSDDEKKQEKKTITPQPIEVEVKVADTPLSSLMPEKTEVQEDMQKEERKLEMEVENVELPRVEAGKIDVLKEVLDMTPSLEVTPKPNSNEMAEEDNIAETVNRVCVERSIEAGSANSLPRLTGEVTGMVDVGDLKSKTNENTEEQTILRQSSHSSSGAEDGAVSSKQRRVKKLRKRRSDSSRSSSSVEHRRMPSSDEEEEGDKKRLFGLSAALPSGSAELSIDTSSTEPLNSSTPVKRTVSDDRDRKCASMGDLYRLENPTTPDSPPLERAVSLELRKAEMEQGMVRAGEQAQVCAQELHMDLRRVGRTSAQWSPLEEEVVLGSSSGTDGRTQIEVGTSEAPRSAAGLLSSTVVMLNQSAEDVTVISTEVSTSGQWVTAEEGDTLLAEAAANISSRRSSTSSSASSSGKEPPMEVDEGTQTAAPLELDVLGSNYVSVSSVTVGDDDVVAAAFETTVQPSIESLRYTSSAAIGGEESVTYVTSAELASPSSLVEVTTGEVITEPEMFTGDVHISVMESNNTEIHNHGPDTSNGVSIRSRKSSTSSSSSSSSSSGDEEKIRRKRTFTAEPLESSPDLVVSRRHVSPSVATDSFEVHSDIASDLAGTTTTTVTTFTSRADVSWPSDELSDSQKPPLLREDSKTRLLQTVLDAHEIKVTPSHKDRRNSNTNAPLSVEVSSLIPPPTRPKPAASAASPHSDREVIEISEDELDAVMLSHRDYLLRQAERLSQSPRSPSTTDGDDPWRTDGDELRQNGDTHTRKGRRPHEVTADGAVSTTLLIGGSGAVTATVVSGSEGEGPESPPPDLQPAPE